MDVPFIKDKDGYILKINVKAGSKRPEIEEIDKEKIKIRLKSQPQDGLANKELLEILSEFLNIPKSKIEIKKGLASKTKLLK